MVRFSALCNTLHNKLRLFPYAHSFLQVHILPSPIAHPTMYIVCTQMDQYIELREILA
jgi:hypothetical protein